MLCTEPRLSDAMSPVAVGGVGGSGTRLVAQILKEIGFFLGSDLSDANDNRWATLLFKRIEILSLPDEEFKDLVDIFVNGMVGENAFTESQVNLVHRAASENRSVNSFFRLKKGNNSWLKKRGDSLLSRPPHPLGIDRWSWKEPNTHVFLDRLLKVIPNMKYIHVVRNGLDMAHSKNQNQLRLWGPHFIKEKIKVSPYYSLKYWAISHKRILDIGKPMGGRFLFLNYDHLCLEPENSINKLLRFLDVGASESDVKELSKNVCIPKSMGRFKSQGLNLFDPADVSFVRQLGFDVSI